MGISLGQLLGLGGKPQYARQEGWEPFTSQMPSDEFDTDLAKEWADLIRKAEQSGIKVEFRVSGLHMSYGKSRGVFKDAHGGLQMAREFVRSLS